MSKKKKTGITIAIGIFCVSLLLFIGSDCRWENEENRTTSEKIVLEIWYPWSAEGDVLKEPFLNALKEFNEEQSEVQVEAEGFGRKIYMEKLPRVVASGNMPDIFYCFTDGYLSNVVQAGKALPLNNYLDHTVYQKITEDALAATTVDSCLYGLSFMENEGVFLVNMDMFETYGIEVPSDWKEFVSVCEEFLEKGITPLACGNESMKSYTLYLEAICLYSSGKEACIQNLRNGWETDIGTQRFSELVRMGAFGDREISTQQAEDNFFFSRVPMYYTESDIVGKIIQKNCPLYNKVKIIPFPCDEKYQYETLGGITDTFAVSGETKYPQEAVDALSEITEKLSANVYQGGIGIPTWNTAQQTTVAEPLFQELEKQSLLSKNKMPYWEIYLSGKSATKFLQKTEELFKK